MEFVRDEDLLGVLKVHGVTASTETDDRVYLRMAAADGVVARIHLKTADADADPEEGARVFTVDAEKIPDAIDSVIHKLHLREVLLVPVGKWRHLFDAVAFRLAENEDWQEIDATATVELNTRDPLLCEPGDFHTLSALMHAIISDAERPEQGVMLTTTTAPLLVEVVPEGTVRMSFGSQVMADEVAETLES
ncbi:MAG: hypothetical protein HKO59_11030 [Phycisphaerales bacterium]|nr:hypothetical protein [Phycisphaerales bacterium]